MRQFVVGDGRHPALPAERAAGQHRGADHRHLRGAQAHAPREQLRLALPPPGRAHASPTAAPPSCSPLTGDTQSRRDDDRLRALRPRGRPRLGEHLVLVQRARLHLRVQARRRRRGSACTSPRALTGPGPGIAHLPGARATDAAGNVDRHARPTRTWTVDTAAPDTTIGSGPTGTVASTTATLRRSAPPRPARPSSASSTTAPGRPAPRRARSPDSPRAPTPSASAPRDAAGQRRRTPRPTRTLDRGHPARPTPRSRPGPRARWPPPRPASRSAPPSPARRFECKLDDGAWQTCTSPRALTGLAQGSHTFRVRATDAAGNTDATEATRTWTVDTVAPDTTIGSGPTGTVASTSATLGFSSPDAGRDLPVQARRRRLADLHLAAHAHRPRAGSPHLPRARHRRRRQHRRHRGHAHLDRGHRGPDHVDRLGTVAAHGARARATLAFTSSETGVDLRVQARLGAGWQPCESPHTLTGLSDGAHRSRVRATDAAGNTDPTEATRSWTVDTGAPDTSIGSGPSGPPPPRRRASASPRARPAPRSSASSTSGAWQTCTSPRALTGLAQGAHTFRVRATDPAGNADPSEATRSWTVDTVAPDTTIDSGPVRARPRRRPPRSRSLRGPGAGFECKLDDGAWQTCTSPRALDGLARGLAHLPRARRRRRPATSTPPRPPAPGPWTPQAPETTIGSGPTGPRGLRPRPAFTFSLERGRLELRVQARRRRLADLRLAARAHRAGRRRSHLPRAGARHRGQHRPAEAVRTWTVDTPRPRPRSPRGRPVPPARTRPTLAFSSTEPGSSFECRLDDGAWQTLRRRRARSAASARASTA